MLRFPNFPLSEHVCVCVCVGVCVLGGDIILCVLYFNDFPRKGKLENDFSTFHYR